MFALSWPGAYHWKWQFISISLGYYVAVYLLAKGKKRETQWMIAGILWGTYWLTLFIYGFATEVVPTILAQPVAVLLALFYLRKETSNSFSYQSLPFASIVIVTGLLAMPNWIRWVSNREVKETKGGFSLELVQENGKKIATDTLKEKVLILDFWTTSCGACFRGFPDFEKTYLKYKENEQLQFFLVNLPYSTDSPEKRKKHTKGYSFPKAMATKDFKILKDELKIPYVPLIVIIGEEGEIVYKGSYCRSPVEYCNLDRMIEKILEEREK
jgi:thiol-disulfide isomerase/thioredoxin